jgi:tetratricopeptide (TPR) repeat protein
VFAGDRERYQALSARVRELLERGQTAESLPYLRRMHELQPYNEGLRFSLALVLLQPGAPDGTHRNAALLAESIRHLEECVRLQAGAQSTGPELAERLFHLALALWFAGAPDRALGLFERAFVADPAFTQAIYNRFAIYEELGRTVEAQQELRRFQNLPEKES